MYAEDGRSFLYFAAAAAMETIKHAEQECFEDPECYSLKLRKIYNNVINERIDDIIAAVRIYMKNVKISSWKIDQIRSHAATKQSATLDDILVNNSGVINNIIVWAISHKLILLIILIIVLIMIIFLIVVPVISNK